MRRPIWLMICLIWAPWPYAMALNSALDVSQHAHTAWRVRDGFTKGGIWALAQTPDGFLWLGTEFGLVRFDGVRADSWQPPPGASLPDSRIRSLFVAHDGGLWIGTDSGLASWSHGKLVTDPQLYGWAVNGLAEDSQGTLWATASNLSTSALCAIQGSRTECYGSDGRFGAWAGSILEDRHGNLWLSAANGVWRWRPGPPQLSLPVVGPGNYQALTETSSGGILAVTVKGVAEIINGKFNEIWVAPTARGWRPRAIFSDADGALWIGSADHGLLHLHDGRMDEFGASDGLSGDNVTRVFEDHEANIWVVTDEGLDRFRALAATTYSPRQGVVGSGASVLADKDGSIWFSTTAGLYHWTQGGFAVYRAPGRALSPGSSRSSAQTAPLNEVLITGLPEGGAEGGACLFQDHRGRLWLGMAAGFGYLEHNRFVSIDEVPHGYIDSIVEDRDGNLWIAHRDAGLLELSADRVVRQIPWTQMIGSSLGWKRVAFDPVSGGLWVGFYAGVILHLVDGQVRASYGAGDGLGKGPLNGLRVASDGTVWVATFGGLSRLRAGHIATLTTRDGLPCDQIDSSIEDEGALWLYTACGLVHVAAADLQLWSAEVGQSKPGQSRVRMTVLGNADGIRSFGDLSSFSPHIVRTADGRLWLTGVDGLTVVDPHHTAFNKLPPPVDVERLVADRTPYNASAPQQLPARVRDLEIGYTALSLVAPERIQFRYILEGRDREWQEAGNRRSAIYTDLAPGSYRFHVIASNNSGVWNTQGAALDFSIAPAYWQTVWFRALCVVAFLGLLWTLYQLRLRQVTRAFELGLEARVAERTRIARELHDTLLQSFQGLLLRFQTAARLLPTRPVDAKEVLESTMDQAEQALADGRNAVQGLRPSAVESYDLTDAIKSVGEELAADPASERFIPLSLRVEGAPRKLQPIVRDEIYRIAGEALRNSYRHSGATRIEVELQYDERHFELRVRDDGKGIDSKFLSEAGHGKHFGLSGMRERAAMIGGKLTLWTSPDSGTEIELTVPGSLAYRASLRRRSWFERLSTARGARQS
jgi:signal transduction histidine kinase/ligand-binding sensor domain-containing protein